MGTYRGAVVTVSGDYLVLTFRGWEQRLPLGALGDFCRAGRACLKEEETSGQERHFTVSGSNIYGLFWRRDGRFASVDFLFGSPEDEIEVSIPYDQLRELLDSIEAKAQTRPQSKHFQ